MATTSAAIDRARVLELTERERTALFERTPASQAAFERAVTVMPRGVPSSFQAADPRPTYLSHGRGAHVWDVDGNEYVDFHNGFGVMCVGHANPAIVTAVSERAARGSHFAAPTEGSIVVARELRRRFGLPQWRFTNSGTESTMDAVHLARGATGRDLVLKIEGSYHGHHDAVMVSVRPPLDALGPREQPSSVPFGGGHPHAVTELTKAIPFNDADLLEGVLDEIGDRVAALILEPAMMNITIVCPRRGYLERVRELTARHGIVLVFDEVKTGCTIGPGGATERFGVRPDIVCLAKATCGGYPGGAIGMTEDAYARLEAMNERLLAGLDDVIARHGLPCHTVGLAAKGCVVFSSERLYEYRDYATKVDEELSTLAWLYHMNHGIFMTPGVDEQWTLSVAHDDADVQRYVDAFEAFARDVTA
jgi:glutamate-1-semialdehyde 2,1-aminomutase